jgi:hypothetical protein
MKGSESFVLGVSNIVVIVQIVVHLLGGLGAGILAHGLLFLVDLLLEEAVLEWV